MTKEQFQVKARQDIQELFTQAEELEKYKDQLPEPTGPYLSYTFENLYYLAAKLQNEYNELFFVHRESWGSTKESFLTSKETFQALFKDIEIHLN